MKAFLQAWHISQCRELPAITVGRCTGAGPSAGSSSQQDDLFLNLCVGCRVGIKTPTVIVQYAGLGVDAVVHVGSRALPSVWNSYRNTFEVSSDE